MPIFKYYRPNIYFEKSIRYNELYFSANHELNDPNDLKATYYFEDSPSLWKNLLSLKPISPAWNILHHISAHDELLINELNTLFKNVTVDSLTGSIREIIQSREPDLKDLFERSIIDSPASNESDFAEQSSKKNRVDWCVLIITELLARAVNHQLYSVSFSKSALDPMMWAHYADGFKGCVVIYGGLEGPTIKLRHHLMSDQADIYPLREVKYIDSDKHIPILECATEGKTKVEEAFLQKNSFWCYEQELRLFTSEEVQTHWMAASDKKPENPKQRILYHGTNFISGIIFGPRVSEDYERHIKTIIASNREYADEKMPFYSFNTTLNPHGRLEVSSASKIIDSSLGRMIIENEEREKLLLAFGITKPTHDH
ncbi:DUF2971 domain-containing protein [Pseudomonas sp. CFBP 8770]|uniref:DUF2971 domain-containing protein n=1 Tax=unclassified Pseudomonas TaxID=196821 RepID=UPI001783B5F0|nr:MULTISPECIES: DUF2971 domain-containing protein [unclassified Pseudomonas]MBD8476091.1 DUF2971 domain-containing protein [Pseudomonas sp. CFBP 8773]MBD8648526.1 DUF2971 domain-containing protein [Pseudomonas sp. CFBP 8770]